LPGRLCADGAGKQRGANALDFGKQGYWNIFGEVGDLVDQGGRLIKSSKRDQSVGAQDAERDPVKTVSEIVR
jgi:hypothetical protein